jgi:hypothetical protein
MSRRDGLLKWTACGIGVVAGVLTACWLGVYQGPPQDDFLTRVFSGRLDVVRLLVAVLAEGCLGYLTGSAVTPANDVGSAMAHMAFALACIWGAAFIGIPVGGALADVTEVRPAQPSGDPLAGLFGAMANDFDRYFRRERFRAFGAFFGGLAGYGLLWIVTSMTASREMLAAENEKLRTDNTLLRQGKG